VFCFIIGNHNKKKKKVKEAATITGNFNSLQAPSPPIHSRIKSQILGVIYASFLINPNPNSTYKSKREFQRRKGTITVERKKKQSPRAKKITVATRPNQQHYHYSPDNNKHR
jgi:hypothetical protein